MRAYRYPNLDSLVWRSSEQSPAIGTLLGFDADNGTMAFTDAGGIPGWIDFRSGTVRQPTAKPLSLIASSQGFAIFGVSHERNVIRYTPTGDWKQETEARVRRLFPQPDGSLIALAQIDKAQDIVLRYRPPERGVVDSLPLSPPQRSAGTPLGDRVYFGVGRELVGVPTGDFSSPARIKASDEILAIAPTPSGDRVYLATKGAKALDVVDRYNGAVSARVRMGGFTTELRMDPLGRYLLARPVEGDSAWVVAIATGSMVGTVKTVWRSDLPAVAPDGAIATLHGPDVEFVDPVHGTVLIRVPNGGKDTWSVVWWNGFRPRAKGLDRAVTFQTEEDDQELVSDSSAAPVTRDSTAASPLPVAPRTPDESAVRDPEPAGETPRERGFTVSFAAVLAEDRARELASSIRVDGVSARVVASRTDGTTVYRVVLGPYRTRAEADRVGRESKHSYWILEGPP